MPYPNEHSCRLLEPIKGAETRRKNGERSHEGKKYDVIYQKQKDGKWADQAYRYSVGTWGESDARSHCKDHDGKFEAASKEKSGDISRIIEKINSSAWAIWPPKLEAIHELISSRLAADSAIWTADKDEPFEMQAQARASETTYLQVNDDGIAVIQIMGVTGQRRLGSNWVSTEIVRRDIERAIEDPNVKGILLHIDSPGGMVDGTKALADYVRRAAAVKPIYAYTDGMMASAAYWIGAAAERIYAYPTSEVGSIGVVALHIEFSEFLKKIGIRATYIYNGKFKRLVNDAEPLSDEGKAYIQELVDGVYDIFVEDTAVFRGMKSKEIKALESKVFLAQQAKENGLVDKVFSFNQTYSALRRRAKIMNYDDLKKEHAELYQQVKDEGLKEATANQIAEAHPELVKSLKEEGAQEERSRVTGILDAKADPAVMEKAIREGVSVDGAFKLFYENERIKKKEHLKELENEAAQSVGQEEEKIEIEDKRPKDEVLAQKAKELAQKEKISIVEALRRVTREDPELAKDGLPETAIR